MAVLTKSATTVENPGAWLTTGNVFVSDNTYATNVGTTQNTEYPFEVDGFDFSSIPNGSIISDVTVTIEAKTGTAARAQIKGEMMVNFSTVLPTVLALTNLTAADANYTFKPTPTLAQLKAGGLKVRITNKRIVSQASTTSVDYVSITVTYTAPSNQTLPFTENFSSGSWDTLKWELFPSDVGTEATCFTVSGGVGTMTVASNFAVSSTRLWATDQTDVGCLVTFTLNTSTSTTQFEIDVRASGSPPMSSNGPTNGYKLVLNIGINAGLWKVTAGSSTIVGSGFSVGSLVAGTAYKVRFEVIGTTFYIKVWNAASAEPGAWTVTRTDATYASGQFGLSFSGDIGQSVAVDDLTYYVASLTPKIQTLVDSFDTSLDKTTKWSGSSAPVVWDTSARVKIPCTTAYSALATPGAGSYDLTGSFVFGQFALPALGTGTRETFFEVIRGGVSNDKLSLYVSGANIAARRTNVGTNTNGSSQTYSPTTHAWWRIRESAGTVFFDYSADGLTWNNLWSTAPGFAIINVWLSINSGYFGTETAADTFIDNINVVPSGAATGWPKIWTGSQWAQKPLKVWTGSAWVQKPVKVWTGSAWKTLT